MSLQNPHGLWLLLLAIPLIALYWLRTPRTPRTVPSLRLFRAALRPQLAAQKPRPRWPELSLWLQLLALLLLSLQLAGLQLGAAQPKQAAIAVVLDVSASMAAREADGGRRTRLELAREQAQHWLTASGAAQLSVVLAGHEPQLLAGGDRAQLLASVTRAEAEDSDSSLLDAVALAEQQVHGAEHAQVLVLTDGNSDYQTQKPHVRVQRVGQAVDNWALLHPRASWTQHTAYAASVTSRAPRRLQLSAIAASFAKQPRTVQISLHAIASSQGDRFDENAPALDTREVLLAPGAQVPLQFVLEPGDLHGAYELRLDGEDALGRDDRAVLVPPGTPQLPVVLVAAAGDKSAALLLRALAADDSLDLRQLTPAQYPNADIEDDAFEVWVGQCPSAQRGRDLLVFAPAPGRCLGVDVAAPSGALRTLNGFRSDDPRMRFLTLDDVHVQHGHTLRASSGRSSLAEDREGALMVDASTPSRLRTLVGFAPEHSDFPARRSFVLFLRNLTELATQHRQGFGRGAVAAGRSTMLALGGDDRSVQVLWPNGETRTAEVLDGELALAPSPRAGLLRLRWSAPQPRTLWLGVEYGAAQESELRQAAGEVAATDHDATLDSPSARVASWSAFWHTHSARLIALLVLAALATELASYTRTPRARRA